jgi:hypothetical protein
MITRKRVYLQLRDEPAPDASQQLEREGFSTLPGLLSSEETTALRADVEAVYSALPADVRNPGLPADQREDFRYEMFNRSAACQRLVADRRILDVVEPLLGEDCHVIANTAWRNPPREEHRHGGGHWHIDAGPHVPRPPGVAWDDRIPYPVFAIGVHVHLQDCPLACGPTAVIPGSHRSGQHPPFDRLRDTGLAFEGQKPLPLIGSAGDVHLFVSDVWHRRLPTASDDSGRFFVQIHYGRRDLAQRIRPTRDVHQLSAESLERAHDPRERTVLGLHDPLFYDG